MFAGRAGNKGAKELADVLNMNYALETLYLEGGDEDVLSLCRQLMFMQKTM